MQTAGRSRDWRRERGSLQWVLLIQVLVFHAGLLLAPWYYTRAGLMAALFLWVASMGFGICIGFHRLLAHRSFETHPLIRGFLVLLGTLAMQGGPSVWVGTHRQHHKFADMEGDPHSPKDDFWWGHHVWLYFFEHWDTQHRAEDVLTDAWVYWLDRCWFVPGLVLAIVLGWWGGMSLLIWGVFVRVVLVWHFTWFVNSISHRWGYRNFATRDESRNNVLVAALSFGEGWHNNHHAFPQSARHGLRRWELDIAYEVIRLLERSHLAWSVKVPRVGTLICGRPQPRFRRLAS